MPKPKNKQNIISFWCFRTVIKSLTQEGKKHANKSSLMANLL